MASRQGREPQSFVAVPEVEHLDADYEVSDEEKAFENFRNSLDAGSDMAQIRISKVPEVGRGNPMASRTIYCFAAPIDRYTFEELCEYIRENYGGGLFRIVGTKKGHKGAAFNQLVEIAEVVKKKADGSASPSVSAIMESVSTMIDQASQRTEALLARFGPTAPTAPAVDPVALFERSLGIVSGLMARMQPAAPPPGNTLMEQIMMLGKIKEVFGGGFVDGGGGSSEANFWDAITTGMKQFGPALTALAAQKAGGAPALGAPALIPPTTMMPTNGPSPTLPRQPNPAPEVQIVNPIKRQVDMLLVYAKGGTSAEDLADTVLNMTPDDKLADLKTFISRPTVVDEMIAANPEVANYRVYFDTLKVKLLEFIAEIEREPTAAQNDDPAGDGLKDTPPG